MTGNTAPCADCGAPLGGRAGCDRAFHELGARAAADVEFAYRRRALVDAYCLQHPAYVRSLKSLAAHLCGLCAAVERGGDARAERAIWSDLRVPADAVKPPLPSGRTVHTLAAAYHAATPEEFRAAVDEWIAAVWTAWVDHHVLARHWLEYSMARTRRARR